MEDWVIYEKFKRWEVLKPVKNDVRFWCESLSKHLTKYRVDRLNEMKKEKLDLYRSFVVDTGHIRGYELHSIYKNGYVIIGGVESKQIITAFALKSYQLEKYGISDESFYQDLLVREIKKEIK